MPVGLTTRTIISKERNCLYFLKKMRICDQTKIRIFVFDCFIRKIRLHGIDMQAAFWMFLKEITNDLWHKIKVHTVNIHNPKLCRRLFKFDFSCLNP